MHGVDAERRATFEEREKLGFSLLLIAIAGWIDAVGFIAVRGFFPSFMSGNSTTFGVDLVRQDWSHAARVGALIGLFVFGAGVGEALALASSRRGRVLVFLLEAALLWLAAAGTWAGWRDLLVLLALTAAMGVQNAAVHRAAGIAVTLTYVTGTLVHFGQTCARVLAGRANARDLLPWAGIWGGLMVGSLAGGAVTLTQGRLAALIVPAGVATLCAVAWAWAPPRQ